MRFQITFSLVAVVMAIASAASDAPGGHDAQTPLGTQSALPSVS
jgi:hypothetical protein